jgi:hypothetical protein
VGDLIYRQWEEVLQLRCYHSGYSDKDVFILVSGIGERFTYFVLVGKIRADCYLRKPLVGGALLRCSRWSGIPLDQAISL